MDGLISANKAAASAKVPPLLDLAGVGRNAERGRA
jgi:hypothetical protein